MTSAGAREIRPSALQRSVCETWSLGSHNVGMLRDRVLRVRVPSDLIAELDREAERAQVNRSTVARWRLSGHSAGFGQPSAGEPLTGIDPDRDWSRRDDR
jgi:hypothetical protein